MKKKKAKKSKGYPNYKNEVLTDLQHVSEFPAYQIETVRTKIEVRECFLRGYSVSQAINYIVWGIKPEQ